MKNFKNDFNEIINAMKFPNKGCFNVVFEDRRDGTIYETQGDKINKNYTWDEFFNWLTEDIDEMNLDIDNLILLDISYAGKENMCVA